jgi:hypothetical protein
VQRRCTVTMHGFWDPDSAEVRDAGTVEGYLQ